MFLIQKIFWESGFCKFQIPCFLLVLQLQKLMFSVATKQNIGAGEFYFLTWKFFYIFCKKMI